MNKENRKTEDVELSAEEIAASDAAFDSMKDIDWTDEERISEMERSIDNRKGAAINGNPKPVSDGVIRDARDTSRIDEFLKRKRPESK